MATINVSEDPILALRNAIIQQAAIDYKQGFIDPEGYSRTIGCTKKIELKKLKTDAENFLNGSWCEGLMSIDNSQTTGEYILRRIKETTLAELKEGQKEGKMKVKLIQQTPNPIDLIADTASICYDSRPTNKKALVKHLYLNGHHSTFEHVYFTFKIEGISRACSHQLVRHRLAVFTQRSQRYCNEDAFKYVLPDGIALEDETRKPYENLVHEASDLYADFVHMHDIKKEDARYMLQNACTTELYMSCNLRELIHIANERLCSRAQWEIRKLVQEMVKLVDPDLQWMLVPKCESGFSICNTPCRGSGYKIFERERER